MSKKTIKKGKLEVKLLFFDSLGARSCAHLVKTPDITILVDPGAAVMQPSYPLTEEQKSKLRLKALKIIGKASEKADYIFISHYHYDHHILPSVLPRGISNFYANKTLWIKNPNKWINYSQWERARLLLNELSEGKLEKVLVPPKKITPVNFKKLLPIAFNKNYGDYQKKHNENLKRGESNLLNLMKMWDENYWIKEFETKNSKIEFADNKYFKIGKTIINFTRPMFHGIEYTKMGWIIGISIEYGASKYLYTSDLQGPKIEDYAEWIIQKNPDILILDGPPTYLLGYLMSKINFERAKNNIIKIIKETKTNPIIYDHHNLREKKYKERLKDVYKFGEGRIFTAAECMGETPLILKLMEEN